MKNLKCLPTLALFLLLIVALTTSTSCSQKKIDGAIHLVILENPKSLDPIQSSDALASEAIGSVYETFLQYHYLKRPYELVPLLSEKMPKYSKDGLTVTLKIKSGVKFQDDPCFKDGLGRELLASDFIYSFKRLADPKNQSDGWWVFDGKIIGLNEWRDQNAKLPATDYSQTIDGLKAIDTHTLQIKLKKKYPQLNYVLAMNYTAPVPHEAIEKYGLEFASHPVGTGPFVITEYTRSSRIVFEKNKNFHGESFPMPEIARLPAADCVKKIEKPKLLETCKVGALGGAGILMGSFDYGKALPLSEKIILHIFLERQPAWLEFLKGNLDYMILPKDNFQSTIGEDKLLKADLRDRGIKLSKDDSTTEWFLGFYMNDPLLGKNKNLRKAIGLAYDSKKDIDLFTNGIAKPSNQILPSQISGFNPNIPPREFNLEKAREFLAKAGYPAGKGLPSLNFDVEGSSMDRQRGEFFKNQMAQIGINANVRVNTRPELFDRRKKGKLQIHMDGWIADYPDAENFMQLLYGPNQVPGPNNSAFKNAEFDKLYEQMAGMPPSPERQKIINRMTQIFLDEAPWVPNWIATLYHLHQGWLKNYVYSDFAYNNYKYYRLDYDEKVKQSKAFH
jgi:oligopeptide transport system substrate-binding protein